jgi:hypothetical protein
MRRIFGLKWDEDEESRRLYNEEFYSLYRSSNIVRAIKSRRFRWAGMFPDWETAVVLSTNKHTGETSRKA